MVGKLEIINEQLDEIIVKQLELMQIYINVTTECESHQKSGFLNMAKARYIQGSHTVSKNCLFSEDSEVERSAVITVSRKNSTIGFEGKNGDVIPYQEPSMSVATDTDLESQLNKQFGFLSSGTLKLAKTNFRNCLEKTIERASVIQQMFALRQRYEELMKEKMNNENSNPVS